MLQVEEADVYYLLLTTHYSLLTTYYLLLTTYYLLLTTYYLLLTTYVLLTYYLLRVGLRDRHVPFSSAGAL